jgi:hypothetical protein
MESLTAASEGSSGVVGLLVENFFLGEGMGKLLPRYKYSQRVIATAEKYVFES